MRQGKSIKEFQIVGSHLFVCCFREQSSCSEFVQLSLQVPSLLEENVEVQQSQIDFFVVKTSSNLFLVHAYVYLLARKSLKLEWAINIDP